MSSAISIEDLTFTYQGNERPALQNIQGKMEDGTFGMGEPVSPPYAALSMPSCPNSSAGNTRAVFW